MTHKQRAEKLIEEGVVPIDDLIEKYTIDALAQEFEAVALEAHGKGYFLGLKAGLEEAAKVAEGIVHNYHGSVEEMYIDSYSIFKAAQAIRSLMEVVGEPQKKAT